MVDEIHHESSRGFWCFGSPALATGILTSLLNGSFAEFRTLVSSRICRWAFLSCLILSPFIASGCSRCSKISRSRWDSCLSANVNECINVLTLFNYMKRGAKMSLVLQHFACRCLTILFDNKVDARCLVEKCIVAMAKKHLDLKNVTCFFFSLFSLCISLPRVSGCWGAWP